MIKLITIFIILFMTSLNQTNNESFDPMMPPFPGDKPVLFDAPHIENPIFFEDEKPEKIDTDNSYQDDYNKSIKVFYEMYRGNDYIPLFEMQNTEEAFELFIDEFIMIDSEGKFKSIETIKSILLEYNEYDNPDGINAFKIKMWYINGDSNKIICIMTPVKIDNPSYYSTSTVG